MGVLVEAVAASEEVVTTEVMAAFVGLHRHFPGPRLCLRFQPPEEEEEEEEGKEEETYHFVVTVSEENVRGVVMWVASP